MRSTDRSTVYGSEDSRQISPAKPIKATVPMTEMQTIDVPQPKIAPNKKPPLLGKARSANPHNHPQAARASAPAYDTQSEIASNTGSDYYQIEDTPLSNPELELKKVAEMLKTSDWAKHMDSCNTLRRIATFHPMIFSQNQTQFHNILKELIKLVDSLRSQVAKNSILLLNILFDGL